MSNVVHVESINNLEIQFKCASDVTLHCHSVSSPSDNRVHNRKRRSWSSSGYSEMFFSLFYYKCRFTFKKHAGINASWNPRSQKVTVTPVEHWNALSKGRSLHKKLPTASFDSKNTWIMNLLKIVFLCTYIHVRLSVNRSVIEIYWNSIRVGIWMK